MTDIWADTNGLETPLHWEILDWLEKELEYADKKRAEMGEMRKADDENMAKFKLSTESVFNSDALSYFNRAVVLGVDTARGRQALGKCITTLIAALESSVRVFGGKMPSPGKPSGEV